MMPSKLTQRPTKTSSWRRVGHDEGSKHSPRPKQDADEKLSAPHTKVFGANATTAVPLENVTKAPPKFSTVVPTGIQDHHRGYFDGPGPRHPVEDIVNNASRGPPSPSYAEVAGKPRSSRTSTVVPRCDTKDRPFTARAESPAPIFATSTPSFISVEDHLEFCNPFHKHQPTVYLTSSHRDKFATELGKSVQDLRAWDVEDAQRAREAVTQQEFGQAMDMHRERLCKAVAYWGWHGSQVKTTFCDHSVRRKPPSSALRPTTYELQGVQAATVPLQRYHKGPYAIPREKADVKPSDVQQLLNELNDVLGTQYTIERPGLQAYLQGYVDESCDFGLIYGYLRPWWLKGNFHRVAVLMHHRKEEDTLLRKNAVDGDCIVNPHIPPRRVWDLYSNRVVPFHVLQVSSPSTIPANVWAVSHSWKEPAKRRPRKTRINGKAWAVPLPQDTDLHGLRIELLNLGAEYVFLDVLCLRQHDPQKMSQEFRRKKEWRLDVPTIGYIYQPPRVTIVYFNGLGEEFLLDPPGGLHSPVHWFMRVWTLQETTQYWLPGGLTHKSLDLSVPRSHIHTFNSCLRDALQSTKTLSMPGSDLFQILAAIRDRRFASPVDSIAGLAYPLRCQTLPIYNADMDLEDAWEALIQSMSPFQRLMLLVCWRGAGDSRAGGYTWRPTWRQVTDCTRLAELQVALQGGQDDLRALEDELVQFLPNVGHLDGSDAYFHYAYVIRACYIQTGPDECVSDSASASTQASSDSEGTEGYESSDTAKMSSYTSVDTATTGAFVEVRAYGRKYTYKITRLGAPLGRPRDKYTLVGVCGRKYWIVGRESGSRRIGPNRGAAIALSKVAVLELDTSGKRTPEDENLGHVDMVVYR